MKSLLNQIARLSLALLIPASFLMSCQENLVEPDQASYPKSKMKKPPSTSKKG